MQFDELEKLLLLHSSRQCFPGKLPSSGSASSTSVRYLSASFSGTSWLNYGGARAVVELVASMLEQLEVSLSDIGIISIHSMDVKYLQALLLN